MLDFQEIYDQLKLLFPNEKILNEALASMAGYESVPPTIDEFCDSPDYMGNVLKVYPYWRRILRKIFPSPFYSPYKEIILTGPIGSGKSTTARIGMAYELCCFLHRINPHADFGFNLAEPIAIAFFNATSTLSEDTQTKVFKDMLDNSPFFQRQTLRKQKNKKLTRGSQDINMPHNIEVLSGSQSHHALGRAVLNAVQSELNHVKAQKAFPTYLELKNRIKSRFERGQGLAIPGHLWLDSSKKDETGFLENYMKQAREDEETLIVEDPQWVILGDSGKRKYSGATFKVFRGSRSKDPFILERSAEFHGVPDDHCIDVPVEEKRDFIIDCVSALRDIAGISVWASGAYITSQEKIASSLKYDNPCEREVIELDFYDETDRIIDYIDLSKLLKKEPYYVHFDLGKVVDRAGAAFTRFIGTQESVTKDKMTGAERVTQAHHLRTDLVLALQAKTNQEIPFYKIQKFLVDMQFAGFHIAGISFDQAFSADLMQRLSKDGFIVEYISVDRNREQYDAWKQAMLEGRWTGPYHSILENEMKGLIDLGKKIDHPTALAGGGSKTTRPSKDIIDAVVGSFWHCQERNTLQRADEATAMYLEAIETAKQNTLAQNLSFQGQLSKALFDQKKQFGKNRLRR